MLAEIEGFAMRRITDFEKALEENRLGRFASRSSAEQPIEIVDPPGIPPLEGARALTRILLAATPHSSGCRCSASRRSDARNRALSPQATDCCRTFRRRFRRRHRGTLASWWQELLGVEAGWTGRRLLCARRSFPGRRAPVCQDQEDLAGQTWNLPYYLKRAPCASLRM